jgi:hypothetical protein
MVNPFRPKTVKTPAQLVAEEEAEKMIAHIKASEQKPKLKPIVVDDPAKPAEPSVLPAAEPDAHATLTAGAGLAAHAAEAAENAELPAPLKLSITLAKEPAQAIVKAVLLELPELLAVAVIDIETGRPIAKHSPDALLDVERAAPHYAAIVKRERLAIEALKLADEQFEEMIVTLQQQLHLLRVITGTDTILYISVSPKDSNMSVAREILRQYAN